MKNKIFFSLSFFMCVLFFTPQLHAQPMLGEIKIFAGNYAPRGWALCHGQLLSISQNSALFSLLGTNYGGDGRTTFGLPDLRGRVPVGEGYGPGLSRIRLGEKKGAENTTLQPNQMPSISIDAPAYGIDANNTEKFEAGKKSLFTVGNAANTSAPIQTKGANAPINIMQPSLIINYIICLQGTFPSPQ